MKAEYSLMAIKRAMFSKNSESIALFKVKFDTFYFGLIISE